MAQKQSCKLIALALRTSSYSFKDNHCIYNLNSITSLTVALSFGIARSSVLPVYKRSWIEEREERERENEGFISIAGSDKARSNEVPEDEEDEDDDGDMPCLNISTNVSLDGLDTSAILSETTSGVAKLIGKPEAYVMIVLKGSVPMAFGGTEQPAAYGELVSIGGLNPDVNKKLSAAIASILETKLSIPKSRFFLKFYDTKANQSQEYAQCLHALHQH
ncbi:hypothetical protein EUGRSUZ_K02950 [Eucalyptus grandis]|uniref:Uncharacterized protein n=3 Tax=Eucalyptus grandis TaxID=71139 RepID=A0ACC3IY53_EUCGR|nr:hypothetical protein EUGRSUZ_K02950 [Eucalyptus grandis]